MISQREELRNEGQHIQQLQNGVDCKKMVSNPMSTTKTIIEGSE